MKKKRKGWVRIIVILLIVALLGGGAYWLWQRGAGGETGSAYVQSVASVTGMANVGMFAQYNGIVEAKDVIEINPSGDMAVKECYVTAGAKVTEGDPLFCYDVDDLTLSHAQLLIDITGMENNLRTYREQLESLEKRLEKAKEKDRYDIELEIQTVSLDIRKGEYDLKDKQQKAEEMQRLIDASVVYSPATGTVRSVRSESDGYDPYGYSGDSSAYISIIAGTAFCVKGTVNEQTIYTLYPGMPVLIRSRIDDTVRRGTIYSINTDTTESGQGGMVYYDGGDRASKYAFYVEPESIEGLLIGQHVLIDLNTEEETNSALMLPAAFLMQEGDSFYVWAANDKGRIEKRAVAVGAYDEATECREIVSGLSLKDRIAFPDDTVREGMLATETAFADPSENGMNDAPGFPSEEMPGTWEEMPFDEMPADDPMTGTWETSPDEMPVDDGTDTVIFGG